MVLSKSSSSTSTKLSIQLMEIRMINKFLKDENGATAIEYGLIAALVAVAIVGALTTLGGGLSSMFGTVNSDL